MAGTVPSRKYAVEEYYNAKKKKKSLPYAIFI